MAHGFDKPRLRPDMVLEDIRMVRARVVSQGCIVGGAHLLRIGGLQAELAGERANTAGSLAQ